MGVMTLRNQTECDPDQTHDFHRPKSQTRIEIVEWKMFAKLDYVKVNVLSRCQRLRVGIVLANRIRQKEVSEHQYPSQSRVLR